MRFRVGGGKYLEIHTDQGLVGIGPAMDASLLPTVNEQLAGKDPFDIETHAARLQYYAGGRTRPATGSVDIALWDLIGKACGQPLYKLWRGRNEKVPVYASTVQLSTPERAALLAAELLEQGWKAVKLRLHHETLDEDLRTVEAVRAEVGDRMEIMADANQAQSPGSWQPGVRWDLERGVYDIVQPDSRVSGGITELRKVGALAEAFGKRVVPHHGGGGIGTIAHLHLVASWPHAPYLELLHEPPVGSYGHRLAVFRNPPVVDPTGYMRLPEGPGLGVEIDPDLIARA
jgi:L-alanine-DL-glutamate epimerase-like enolase superfamily enzyme